MSEIEKLYKSIFGEFAPNCSLCVKLVDCKIFNNTRNCNKFECDYKSLFTAEKQLAIVKFLLGKSVYYDTDGDRAYWFHISDEIENSKYREFDEAIAECINKMWEDLRDYEKVQIKEILE